MYCKVCNTRMGENARVCPNCGKVVASAPLHPRAAPEPERPPRGEAPVATAEADELEVSLEQALEEVEEAPEPARPRPEPARPASPESAPAAPASRTERSRAARSRAPASAPLLGLEPDALRELVAGDPELIEPGLRALTASDEAGGGPGYATPIGAIDLLARDSRGALVVVQVAEPGAGASALSEVLQRVGWVRKHLAEPGQPVRAIVLAESAPGDLGYAAAAVAETVAFKTWRVRLELEDVPL